jgi:hypothetical protein
MDAEDAQTLRDVRYFTSRLLLHAGILPSDLVAMLEDYKSELDHASLGRWASMGDPAQYADLARRIGQSITDGEWLPGVHLDWPLNRRYGWDQTRETVMKALQLLAIRGELVLKGGKYYVVGSRGESS